MDNQNDKQIKPPELNKNEQSPIPEPEITEQERTTQHKKAMIKALENSLGVVLGALKALEKKGITISRSSHYLWMKEDITYRAAVEEMKEIALDFTESCMFKGIKDGKESLIKYHLSTQGKERGYIPRSEFELTGKNGGPISIVPVDYSKLSKKALQELLDATEIKGESTGENVPLEEKPLEEDSQLEEPNASNTGDAKTTEDRPDSGQS